jgi:hypothetical protein
MDKKNMVAALAALLTSVGFAAPVFAHGAIAIDDEQQTQTQTGYGMAAGRASPEDAERAAMWDCHEFGNDHCRVAVKFEQCGAYAAAREHQGYGHGSTRGIAVKNALAMCKDATCKVVIARCEGQMQVHGIASLASPR